VKRKDTRERGYKSFPSFAFNNESEKFNLCINGLSVAASEGGCRVSRWCWTCDTSESCWHPVIDDKEAFVNGMALLVIGATK